MSLSPALTALKSASSVAAVVAAVAVAVAVEEIPPDDASRDGAAGEVEFILSYKDMK